MATLMFAPTAATLKFRISASSPAPPAYLLSALPLISRINFSKYAFASLPKALSIDCFVPDMAIYPSSFSSKLRALYHFIASVTGTAYAEYALISVMCFVKVSKAPLINSPLLAFR